MASKIHPDIVPSILKKCSEFLAVFIVGYRTEKQLGFRHQETKSSYI